MKNLIKYDSGQLESHILRRGFMDGYTLYPESDEDQDGVEGNEEGRHHDNNGDCGEDGDPGHGNDQYQDGGEDHYQDHQDIRGDDDDQDHQDAGVHGTMSSD